MRTFKQLFLNHSVMSYTPYIDPALIDATIVGGGDLITPYFFNNFYFPAALRKHPLWVYGVSITDSYNAVTSEVDLYRCYMARSNKLIVRDEYSSYLANQLELHDKIEIAPDIAFGFTQPNYPRLRLSNDNKKSIGICLHAYNDQPIELLLQLFRLHNLDQFSILLISTLDQASNVYSDISNCQLLAQRLREQQPKLDVQIFSGHDLETTYSAIQSVDFLISFKLHPALAALRNGIPVFCLSDASKVHSLLSDLDLSDFGCIMKVERDVMNKKFERFLNEGCHLMNSIRPNVIALEQHSLQSLEELKHSIEAYNYDR